ncbi:MAG: RNA methyltransferase [Holophagales bacterium]|nr:MAG: RNA methyltransferase [Holophagales bacterium]
MISSRQNQFIKAIRNLRHSKGDRALLEGEHLIGEAIRGGLRLEWILATPEFSGSTSGANLLARTDPSRVHLVSDDALRSVADVDSPSGVIAAADLPRSAVTCLSVAPGECYLYLERVQDPGNLGAIVRAAEASGARGIALSAGCAHPNHPRALRASAGSLLRVPVAVDCSLAELVHHLATATPRVLALDAHGESLYRQDLSGTVVLALGSEGLGLTAETLATADRTLAIPIAAPVESLNVAVAAAITLFERRRRLHPDEAERLDQPARSRRT